MNEVYEEIIRTQKPKPPIEQTQQKEGYIWVNMLIRFTLDGKAEVVRSFSKPAKESTIKNIIKPKKFDDKIKLEEESERKLLF